MARLGRYDLQVYFIIKTKKSRNILFILRLMNLIMTADDHETNSFVFCHNLIL